MAVERAPGGSSLIDVLDRVLDKGIVIDAYVRDYARWTPRAPAVVIPGRAVSYAEFDADIDRCGASLRPSPHVPP